MVNASAAFLERQRLNNLADGAAIAAADGLDEAGFYANRDIVLDPGEARRLVGNYLAGEGVRVVRVSVADDRVTYTWSASSTSRSRRPGGGRAPWSSPTRPPSSGPAGERPRGRFG